MLGFGRAGVSTVSGASAGFAPPSEPVLGNGPPWTGSHAGPPDRPGPHPPTQPLGGDTGDTDGFSGVDPAAPAMSPFPRRVVLGAEQENDRRYGLQGFNDQLQVRDRHAYWDRGRQRFRGPASNQTGGGANPHDGGPPRADLRTVNISVNPQIGSDASRSQDDLSRAYTWLGQQDGTTVPVYGGVPGLWASYGNRGFLAGIHDPTNGEGGLRAVVSGPPHGLHSDTLPSGKQIADRYKATPQMRPVRLDRPDNSRIAGQSYSQTVQMQGQAGAPAPAGESRGPGIGLSLRLGGRGWGGA